MERNRNMLFAMAALIIMAIVISSCTKDDMVSDSKVQRTTEFIPNPTPVVPTPDPIEWSHKKDSVNNGNSYEFEVVATEYYSEAKDGLNGKAQIALKEYDYYIQEDQVNLSVEYANEHRTMGEAKIVGNSYSRSASFAHEDGNITTVSVDIQNGDLYKETVKDIVLTSIVNVEAASTRAQYVSAQLNTEFAAQVTFVADYNGVSYEYSETLSDKCLRKVLSDDEIADREVSKDNQPIDLVSEYFEVIQHITMKSGDKSELSSTVVAPIVLKTIELKSRNTIYPFNTWVFDSSEPIKVGEETKLKEEGAWTVYYREDTYTNRYVNNSEHIEFEYTLGHCRAIYDDGTVKADWEYKEPNFGEVSIIANLVASDRDGYEAADLVNTVKVSYFGGDQNASEDVILYREVEPEPAPTPEPEVEDYFDESTLIDILTDNFRRVSITWIQTTDGVVTDSQVLTKEFERPLVCKTNWSVDSENYSQNTTGVAAKLTASSPKSQGEWSWNADTYTITEKVNGEGWSESNAWESGEASGIAVIYNGKTYYFADKSVSVNSNATVDGNGNYTSKLAYTFGDNTKASQAPGKINKMAPVVPPFFPSEWGKIRGAAQTVAPTANHIGHVYTLVFRFDNGTLGVIMNGGEAEINWNGFKHFTADTDQSINGLAYNKGNDYWDFVGADDYADALTYVDMNGKMIDNISYPDAKNADRGNWDKDDYKNGHASVHTDRYQLTINGNVLSIVDTRSGINYGSFTSAE